MRFLASQPLLDALELGLSRLLKNIRNNSSQSFWFHQTTVYIKPYCATGPAQSFRLRVQNSFPRRSSKERANHTLKIMTNPGKRNGIGMDTKPLKIGMVIMKVLMKIKIWMGNPWKMAIWTWTMMVNLGFQRMLHPVPRYAYQSMLSVVQVCNIVQTNKLQGDWLPTSNLILISSGAHAFIWGAIVETDLDPKALAPQDYERWSDWCYNNCTLACKNNAL